MSHAAVMTTADAVVETLLRNGMDQVFALPGLHLDPLFDAFHKAQDRLRVIHPRHEQTAAYMALGATLATGRPWPFAVVPGPGFLNAAAALLTAYGMNAPVIGLLGQIPLADIDRGHGHLHEIRDQLGMASHIAKHVARIEAPHEAGERTQAAIVAALSGRQGPAVLECAMDVLPRQGTVLLPQEAASPTPLPIDEEALDRAAAFLAKAKRPLIVVGGGAIGAGAAVAAIAEHLQAPVVSYRRGRGVVPTNHPLAVPLPVGHRLWREADVVLAIGTRLFMQQAQWGSDPALRVVRIDIDAREAERFSRPAVSVTADACGAAPALLQRLLALMPRRPDIDLRDHRAWMAAELAQLEPQMGFLAAIRSALPDDGIFVDEVTQVGFVSRLGFPVTRERTFLSPGYQDNLGWGYGTALGAQAVRPDVPVVAIAGDGGFAYQLPELATAVQHRLPVVVVVFDNGAFFNVKRIQRQFYGNRQIASDLHNPDFVRLAESFAMAAYNAHDAASLERALGDAIASKSPALVHVRCGDMPSPWHLLQMPRVRG